MPHSLYVVPISTYEGPIGVLEVYSRTARSFDQDERSLLIALAATAGIAMTNARLFDEQVRAREEAEQLAHVAAEQAAQLHATLAAMTDGVWICDRSGMIVSVNDAGLHMFGLERSDVVDQPVSVLADLLEVGRGERRRLGLRLALQGETIHAECDVCPHSTNADLTVDIRTTPIRDEMGSVIGAVAVIRDITESKVMERLKEDFLSVAAHELKTPITALKGYTQLALKRTPSSEAQSTHRALRTIDQQADRITKLVQKLLDVSRIQSGHLELQLAQFDLQELIMSVAERARLVAPSHIIDVEPHVPLMVRADHERLEQVIFNLVDNAIKYSPKGEKIQMSADIVGDEVWVSVHDWGVGIPDDKLPHIFERWYQAHLGTHGDYGGMGLGLYISKEIVEQHNGRMWAVSSEAEGTVIGFVLPLDPGQPAGPVPEHA
jgi:PAS domain S-box-containing protein